MIVLSREGIVFLFTIVVFISACNPPSNDEIAEKYIEFTFEKANHHLEEPYLTVNEQGQPMFSWIEKSDNGNQFKFAVWDGTEWGEEKLIASGEDWFVNWADYPQIAGFADGSLMAVFLQKSGSGTFAYDVMTTFSENGEVWSEAKVLHDDGTQTEHGFVSMVPWGENMLISWLDGRNTAGASHGDDGHHHHGQMSLRAALLDTEGNKIEEWELDNRVCDCCQTGITMTENGPVIVFRDRTDSEIRDIGMIRWNDGQWTETEPVYMDLWEIAACPVNGPRITSYEKQLAIAWYTAANGNPEVKLIFSEDSGLSFKEPIKIDLGNTLGRIGLEFIDDRKVLVSWMENNRIMARTVSVDGELGRPIEVATSSEKRSSGFPQLTFDGKNSWVAWTDDQDELKKIRIKKFPE